MKNLARAELEPGMQVAEDIKNYRGDTIFNKGTTLDEAKIAKLARHSIMVVPIFEKIDFAMTHFERVRLSDGFQAFAEMYKMGFSAYKRAMMEYVMYQIPFDIDKLYENIYLKVAETAAGPKDLLDYLYNMMPSEDDMTHAHCFNSALIAGAFAEWMDLSETDRIIFIQTGFVYDIGKLRIPDSILWKTGALTDSERTLLMKHARMGYDMLKRLPCNVHIPLAALQHHERLDGSGYTEGLRGDNIDIFARYISIVDTYEAMTSARVYRQSMNPFQVIERFEENRGYERYDKDVLKTILTNIARNQIGLEVRLSDDTIGKVTDINIDALSRPFVKPRGQEQALDLTMYSMTIEALC